jgi:vitamin B12 transporter
MEARHTLLLIDGVRYGSATLGTPVWENIPLDSIERIEIARGPLSGLYGSEAVGGVVQIFTRKGTPGLHFDASTTAGSEHTGKLAGGLRFGAGAFDGSLQVAHNETRGFSATNDKLKPGNFNPDDDGFRQSSGNARLGWKFAQGWRADVNLLQSDGTNHYDDGPSADSRSRLRTEVQGLQVAGTVMPGWQSTLRVSRSSDESETLATASASPSLGTIASVQQQFGWENTLATPIGTAVLLAEHLQQKVSRPGTPFAISDRTITGIAAGLNGTAGRHTWQVNLRGDHNSQFGEQTTGSLGYGFDLTPAWRAAASYGTSFVQPSFNQLYFPGFGNPALLPEEGRHSEISLRWTDGVQQVRAAYFDNRIRGFITPGPSPSNVDARIDGVSLSYQAQLAQWTLSASADHVDPRNDTAGNANFDKQLARRAKNSLKLAADSSWGAWRLGGTLAAFSKRFDNAANTLPVSGFATLDLHADWQLAREWTLGLALNNVADKTYETVRGFNQPRREAFLTLRYAQL